MGFRIPWFLVAHVQLLPPTLVASQHTQSQGRRGQGSHDSVGTGTEAVTFWRFSLCWFKLSGAHAVKLIGINLEGGITMNFKSVITVLVP